MVTSVTAMARSSMPPPASEKDEIAHGSTETPGKKSPVVTQTWLISLICHGIV
jgi:hypothetical protein